MERSMLVRNLALAGLLTVLLAACSLIPPQNIGDPFGMDGLEVSLAAIDPVELSAAQFTSCDDADGTHCATFGPAPFEDPDLPGIATSLIAGLDVDAGIEASIEVAVAPLPEQITVRAFALSLHLEDASSGAEVDFAARVTADPPVVFAGQGGGVYMAGDVSPLDLTVEVEGADLGIVKDILTSGGSNLASGVVVLDVEESGIVAIDVTLTSDGTTVSF